MTLATDRPTTDELADTLVASLAPETTPDRRVALATYRLLARGEPVRDEQIAGVLDVPTEQVSSRLASWPGVFRDADGAVAGFWGLTINRLDPEYRLVGGPVTLYAWCAWDTLWLPGILGQELRIHAADGLTGAPVTITATPTSLEAVDPAGAVMSFVVPDGSFGADVLTAFCHKVLFFTDRSTAGQWMANHPDNLFDLPLDEAFEVGRLVTAARYGDELTRVTV